MKRAMLVVSLAFLCILVFAGVGNATDISLKGIGGQVGLVMPDNVGDNTIGFGVVADLGTITPALRLEGSADYWGNSWGVEPFKGSWTAISVGGTVKYDFPIFGSFTPFAGGGAGFTISKWDAPTMGIFGVTVGESMSISDTDIGLHFVGGADMPIGENMKFTAQAKYAMGGADAFWLTGAIIFMLQ